MRWCEENTLSFVRLYLAREFLWNPNHEWYKLKYKREIAYSEIINEFKKLTGKCMMMPEVKIKIKNLRSTYTQQVQKILQKSSQGSQYQPSLVWFHEMDRCLNHLPNVRTISTDDYNQETHNPATEWANSDALEPSFKEDGSDPLIPASFTDNEYENSTGGSFAQVKIEEDLYSESNYQERRKRKKNKKSLKSYLIQSKIEKIDKEDEFDIYGKFIASQLRHLDLEKALKVQLEIQNIINEAWVSAPEH